MKAPPSFLALAFTLGGVAHLTATGAAEPGAPSTSLRAAAAAKGILFGSAVKASSIKDDARYREIVVREFSVVTAENELKMAATQPAEGRFDFTKADIVVDFATRHGLEIRGHTLCWDADRYLPKWVLARMFTRQEATDLLRTHIHTVMSRYRGRIKCWDVVNEAVANIKSPDTPLLFHEFLRYRSVVSDFASNGVCTA
jgi:endo-1,4-beta-xylanase